MTRSRAWVATAVVCSALFLLGLDFTVLNVAIPGLRQELGPSMAQTQWIVDGYALALGGCVLAAGTVSDTYGRRRAFVAGLALCAAASVVGALADGAAHVVVARCGMGLGAALFMPATLSTIAHVFQDAAADRRRAMSVWAAVAGIGALTGPLAGGWLVEHYTWRAAFWLNVPVALAVIVLALLVVPESRNPHPGRLDLGGAALSCGGLLALVWGIIEAPGRGWTSWPVLVAFAGAAALLTLFFRWEGRSAAPMFPIAVFRRGGVPAAALALALMSFAVFGAMFLLTLYLQQVRGLSAWSAGLRITPLSIGLAVGAGATSLVSKRFGARVPVTAGLFLIAVGCAVLAGLEPGSSDTPVLVFETLAGFGAGLVAPVATELVMSSVPAGVSGIGSALNDASRQVGSTLGVAVLGSVLVTVSADQLEAGAAGQPAVAGRQAVENLLAGQHSLGAAHSAFASQAVQQAQEAFVQGMSAAAWIGAAATLFGAAVAWLRLPRRAAAPAPGDRSVPEPNHGPSRSSKPAPAAAPSSLGPAAGHPTDASAASQPPPPAAPASAVASAGRARPRHHTV